MKSTHSAKIIEKLSLKYNLPQRVVRTIIMTQYEFLRDSIRSATPGVFETFPSVRLRFFGVWKVQRKKMEIIHANRQRKLERIKLYKNESLHNKE